VGVSVGVNVIVGVGVGGIDVFVKVAVGVATGVLVPQAVNIKLITTQTIREDLVRVFIEFSFTS
jgi:hypothetical protein